MKVSLGKFVGLSLLAVSALISGCKTAPPPVQPPQTYEPTDTQPMPSGKSPIKIYTCNYCISDKQ